MSNSAERNNQNPFSIAIDTNTVQHNQDKIQSH